MSEMMMPCSYEAEQAVLGGLMLDNDRWDEVILQISPEDLFSRPHRMVFRVMAELAGEGLPLDLITITERLENRGDLEQCGGFAYLAEMSKTRRLQPISRIRRGGGGEKPPAAADDCG